MAFKVEGWVYAQQVISELSWKLCPLLKKGGSCASAPYLAFWNPASMMASPRYICSVWMAEFISLLGHFIADPLVVFPAWRQLMVVLAGKAAFYLVWANGVETPVSDHLKWYTRHEGWAIGWSFLMCCRLHSTKLVFSNNLQETAIYNLWKPTLKNIRFLRG